MSDIGDTVSLKTYTGALIETMGREATSCCQEKNFVQRGIVALKSDGGRLTKARRLVLSCLGESELPYNVNELFEKVNESSDGEPIDKVTVYRIVERLEALGLVHRVGPLGTIIACHHDHNHWHALCRCTNCGKASEVSLPTEISHALEGRFKAKKFFPTGQTIQLEGLCELCRYTAPS